MNDLTGLFSQDSKGLDVLVFIGLCIVGWLLLKIIIAVLSHDPINHDAAQYYYERWLEWGEAGFSKGWFDNDEGLSKQEYVDKYYKPHL
jgi:hypothetical protein